MKALPLSDFGLLTVTQACEANGWTPTCLQRWVRQGLLPAVVVGDGRGALFLIRAADLREFTPPPRGRRVGSKDSVPRKRRSAVTAGEPPDGSVGEPACDNAVSACPPVCDK